MNSPKGRLCYGCSSVPQAAPKRLFSRFCKTPLGLFIVVTTAGYLYVGILGLCFALKHGNEYPVPGFQFFNWWWSWFF